MRRTLRVLVPLAILAAIILSAGARGHSVVAQPPPGTCHARGNGSFTLPDRRCTPGAIDPRVTQANIAATICTRGYTRRVRPPESVTETEKEHSMDAYGDRGAMRDYEYDHLIPLELGGAPNSARNLWPEPGSSPNVKDRLEDRLRRLVCEHRLALSSARTQIASDWTAAYRRYVSGRGGSLSGAEVAPAKRRLPHSVALNCQIAAPSISSPSPTITAASTPEGTLQPHQCTPASRARRAAGEMCRWLNTSRRIGSTA